MKYRTHPFLDTTILKGKFGIQKKEGITGQRGKWRYVQVENLLLSFDTESQAAAKIVELQSA